MLHHHDVGSNIVGTCSKRLKQIQVHDGRVHMYFLEQAYARFYCGE